MDKPIITAEHMRNAALRYDLAAGAVKSLPELADMEESYTTAAEICRCYADDLERITALESDAALHQQIVADKDERIAEMEVELDIERKLHNNASKLCGTLGDDCKWQAGEIERLKAQQINIPPELHPLTAALVVSFAEALSAKLRKAEIKYGYEAGWSVADWETICREKLEEHTSKGDPLDVAAYCAFMWHHKWSTAPAATRQPLREMTGGIDKSYPMGECPRRHCTGTLYAEPSRDLSCHEQTTCDTCSAHWFNDPPKPWPPRGDEGEDGK